ncbi:histone acetyltransferase KAT6A [Episyrphus balteatus]|uniref:histone acetyltransferase KAT6A n=1 Tax=Episyrphus balteatus TaxID=286459 RepID=UPI0024858256|nr:histone acetyltransferase KAT6A [Episyrphus balteatus]
MGRLSIWVLLGLMLFAVSSNDIFASADVGPSESECRPYIEKAINELKTGDPNEKDTDKDSVASPEATSGEDTTSKEPELDDNDDSGEQPQADDAAAAQSESEQDDNDNEGEDDGKEDTEDGKDDDSNEESPKDQLETVEISDGESEEAAKSAEDTIKETSDDKEDEDDKNSEEAVGEDTKSEEEQAEEGEDKQSEEEKEEASSKEGSTDDAAKSEEASSKEGEDAEGSQEQQTEEDKADSGEAAEESKEESEKPEVSVEETEEEVISRSKRSVEEASPEDSTPEDDGQESKEAAAADGDEDTTDSKEDAAADDGQDSKEGTDEDGQDSKEESAPESKEEEEKADDGVDSTEDDASKADDSKAEDEPSKEETETESKEDEDKPDADDGQDSKEDSKPEEDDGDSKEAAPADEPKESEEADSTPEGSAEGDETEEAKESEEDDTKPEDELLWEGEIPENLRSRNHITELLQLDEDFEAKSKAVDRVAEIILRDIKRIYENAIKPLESLYKYRDLSNRHFGDPEIFSKPMVLFMGPWSGGKSSIINYLTGNEYTPNSLRTGAEPSPAYFNILTWGNETEVLDGTQLAADYTFSGLQKFGEGLEERLRGLKLPSKLLEKVNIVEIPGILEVRKQVSRLFPFNDACQWFIDRADIIFLVYDPAKLDVGPETEAILDQLKGREYQTRIVLNKADTVKPEELLRVQSALIWNISPLMSSAQPPLMYTTSLWSHPYEDGSPARLLQAQERAFLRDMRTAIDKRIEHKISSARRFAVRVRNHAKMVDCYLTTYFNHKTLFGNKKRIADDIIDHPQNYHIYEGLSTLTNISRYDLPDPEVYRDFFRLNPLYEFKKLSETCTYFRGCPISKLDVAIAYDLPELAGKYKKMAEAALTSLENQKSKS